MKESFWGYWIIVLGIFVIIIMMLISSVTTTNTQDYYMIKDVTEAAMIDAIDYSYYRQYQELKINREKFVENFLRRFAENVSLNTYTIDFYDLYEAPPKVSVKVTTKSGTFSVMGDATSFDIVNKVDSVLETSGTAGSTGRENNSSIKAPETVSTSKGLGLHGDSGTIVTPDSSGSGSSSKVPSSSTISNVVSESWFQDKYYESNAIKSEYKNNPDRFRNELLSDWQSHYNVSFNSQESNQFILNTGKAFSWASSGLDYDNDTSNGIWGDGEDDGYDDTDDEEDSVSNVPDNVIKSRIRGFVNSIGYFDEFYTCKYGYGEGEFAVYGICTLIPEDQFFDLAFGLYSSRYESDFNKFETARFEDLCYQVYGGLPKKIERKL